MAAMYEKQTDEESTRLALHYLEKCLEVTIFKEKCKQTFNFRLQFWQKIMIMKEKFVTKLV